MLRHYDDVRKLLIKAINKLCSQILGRVSRDVKGG